MSTEAEQQRHIISHLDSLKSATHLKVREITEASRRIIELRQQLEREFGRPIPKKEFAVIVPTYLDRKGSTSLKGYPMIDADSSIYAEELLQETTGELSFEEKIAQLMRAVESRETQPRNLQILDIGCGLPVFLREQALAFMDTNPKWKPLFSGVNIGDIRSTEDRELDQTLGVKFHDIPIENFDFTLGYDLIVSRHTIEHLIDPWREIQRIYQSLNEGGEMYLHVDELSLFGKFLDPSFARENSGKPPVIAEFNRIKEEVLKALREQGLQYRYDNQILWIKKNENPLSLDFLEYNPSILEIKKDYLEDESPLFGIYRLRK